jgi:hypothetical protein
MIAPASMARSIHRPRGRSQVGGIEAGVERKWFREIHLTAGDTEGGTGHVE